MSSNAVIITGAGIESVNGIYYFTDIGIDGKERYNQLGYESEDQLSIVWGFNGNVWSIYDLAGDPVYESPEDVEFPWLVTADWFPTEFGVEPQPQVDQYTAPTFGFPPNDAALVIQNFGSVANYLRLRNLGIV